MLKYIRDNTIILYRYYNQLIFFGLRYMLFQPIDRN